MLRVINQQHHHANAAATRSSGSRLFVASLSLLALAVTLLAFSDDAYVGPTRRVLKVGGSKGQHVDDGDCKEKEGGAWFCANPDGTTVVDVIWFNSREGTCPETCLDNIPTILGPDVKAVHHRVDNPADWQLPALENSNGRNILVVARQYNVAPAARYVEKLRERVLGLNLAQSGEDRRERSLPLMVGLFDMGDELNSHGTARYYGLFDYVVRNYYHHILKDSPPGMYLRALGNLTCGTALVNDVEEAWPHITEGDMSTTSSDKASGAEQGKATPVVKYQENKEPWLGVHWLTNENGKSQALSEVVPTSQREMGCSFFGRLRADRGKMADVMSSGPSGPDLCTLRVVTDDSAKLTKGEYLDNFVSQSKITLAPWGGNHESIRTAEAVNYGSVPVLINNNANEHEYLNKFYRPIPGLYATTWEEARGKVEDALSGESASELDRLQAEVVEWKQEYLRCIHGDMAKIFSYAASN